MEELIAATHSVAMSFRKSLGDALVGYGIGGSAAALAPDAFADVDVLVLSRGASERWRIPRPPLFFDVFVVDMARLAFDGQQIQQDHLMRLLGSLHLLQDDDAGTLAQHAARAREALAQPRQRPDRAVFVLYAPLLDLRRKLRRAVAARDVVACRQNAVLLAIEAARVLVVECGGWASGNVRADLRRVRPDVAAFFDVAVAHGDVRHACNGALDLCEITLRLRTGVERTTIGREV